MTSHTPITGVRAGAGISSPSTWLMLSNAGGGEWRGTVSLAEPERGGTATWNVAVTIIALSDNNNGSDYTTIQASCPD